MTMNIINIIDASGLGFHKQLLPNICIYHYFYELLTCLRLRGLPANI